MKARHYIMTGNVWHRRSTPVVHEFSYPLSMVLVDLDELPSFLSALPLTGRRFHPLTLRDRDFVDQSDVPLPEKVRARAESQGLDFSRGKILMLAQLRGLGWQFNPLVIYWHFPEGEDRPDAALAEVRNTPWHQRHWYALQAGPGESLTFFRHAKAFHVSPFMGMEMEYQWQVTWQEPLLVRLTALRGENNVFEVGMRLRAVAVTPGRGWRHLPGLLMQGLRTSSGIYLQALRLWRKKVPFYRHPDKSIREGGR